MTSQNPKKPAINSKSTANLYRKILVIGPPEVGKTSIALTTFGYVEPKIVLTAENMEPTMGLDIQNYHWKDYFVSVWDLAGQELDTWIVREEGVVFPETDLLMIVFQIDMPLEDILYLVELIEMLREYYKISHSVILLHKIDMIADVKHRQDKIDEVKFEITNKFGEEKYAVFGTSILPQFFRAFMVTFSWIIDRVSKNAPLVRKKEKPKPLSNQKSEDDFIETPFVDLPEKVKNRQKKEILANRREKENEDQIPIEKEPQWQD